MRQERILSRPEALLRDPATGASNLAASSGSWFELKPQQRDERYDISMLGLTLAGPGLLSNLDALGGAAGQLDIAVDVLDGYGAVRDLAGLTPEVLGSENEWRLGTHSGTFADREAGGQLDGSERIGLRGAPVALSANPNPAQWSSPTMDISYGAEIAAVSWECWRVLDQSGATVAAPTIELMTGTTSAGGLINWNNALAVASSAAEIERGYTDLAPVAAGNVYRWRVTLPYLDPGVAVEAGETVRRTATFFSLCAWIRLASPRWRFSSLAELIDRSELGRHTGVDGWKTAVRTSCCFEYHCRSRCAGSSVRKSERASPVADVA